MVVAAADFYRRDFLCGRKQPSRAGQLGRVGIGLGPDSTGAGADCAGSDADHSGQWRAGYLSRRRRYAGCAIGAMFAITEVCPAPAAVLLTATVTAAGLYRPGGVVPATPIWAAGDAQ